jgi:hypothetical protein
MRLLPCGGGSGRAQLRLANALEAFMHGIGAQPHLRHQRRDATILFNKIRGQSLQLISTMKKAKAALGPASASYIEAIGRGRNFLCGSRGPEVSSMIRAWLEHSLDYIRHSSTPILSLVLN